MFDTILVPLDGSPFSAEALPHARTLARMSGARVALVRVCEPEAEADAQAYLDGVAGDLTAGGYRAVTMTRSGQTVDAILGAAEAAGAGLIVMSTHGRSSIGRFLLGSVADRVAHYAGVPVLLVRARPNADSEPQTGEAAYQRLLVPLDGSPTSAGALPLARDIAAYAGARVFLLRAVSEPSAEAELLESERVLQAVTGAVVRATDDLPDQPLSDPYQEELDRRRRGARAGLNAASDDLRAAGVEAEPVIEFGNAGTAILDLTASRDIDLIVMATRGRSGLTRFLLGSVAERIVHYGNRPVLLVRSQAQDGAA